MRLVPLSIEIPESLRSLRSVQKKSGYRSIQQDRWWTPADREEGPQRDITSMSDFQPPEP